jgi:hypothetical protein
LTVDQLDELVTEYLACKAEEEEAEVQFFRHQPSLKEAIRRAVAAKDKNGRHFDHQFRIGKTVYPEADRLLVSAEAAIKKAPNFDQLLSLVDREIGAVPGVGELYVYDAAYRIGGKLGLRPDKVYLHAGTRTGAGRLGRDTKKRALEMAEFEPPLRRLTPWQLESFLCIYAKQLSPVRG